MTCCTSYALAVLSITEVSQEGRFVTVVPPHLLAQGPGYVMIQHLNFTAFPFE